MAAPIITPLPTPPIRSDAPADFAVKADNFAASLPGLVTETNASVAFVDQRAIDADASATAAAASEQAAEAGRAEVAANTATVASNTATVVARADEVAANTQQVADNTQAVATNTQAVADALASIAGGPVYSVNGMTGNVTGIATQAGAETLANKTVVDPVVTLGGSQGVAGQVPVSQGAGLPPAWATMSQVISKYFESAEQAITAGGSLTIAHGLLSRPKIINAYLVCKVAENGYTVGDRVEVFFRPQIWAGYVRGSAAVADASNVVIRHSSAPYALASKTDADTPFQITPSNWRLVVRAFA